MFQTTKGFGRPTSVAPFFSYLMEEDDKNCQSYHFSNGEYIFQEGVRDDRVYLIQKGKVEVGYTETKYQWVDMGPFGMIDMEEEEESLKNANWLKKTVLEKGDCLGEPCCLHDTRHDMSARAMGDVQMLSVHGHLLKELCSSSSDLVRCVEDLLSQPKKNLVSAR